MNFYSQKIFRSSFLFSQLPNIYFCSSTWYQSQQQWLQSIQFLILLKRQLLIQKNVTFTFNALIKLDQSNYLIRRYQVLASIRGNRLEKFIDDLTTPPPSHIAQRIEDDLRSVENPEFATWRSHDQVLLGWLLSSMSEGIISLVLNLETSREVWKAIEVQFGYQSKSRLLHLRYMMNSTRNDDLKITDYFIK